ncbi:MAG: type II toxin-antitoxin system RelE/ParE family toxin [Mycobacteriales bacterium]
MVWTVVFHPSAEKELGALPASDRVAVLHAVEKLAALGPTLPHPHQSDVRGGQGLRELRPRAGRSRIRPLYGRVGDAFVIVAIGPEALVDRRGLDRAVRVARQRLAEVEE